jgi:hypothetical protein
MASKLSAYAMRCMYVILPDDDDINDMVDRPTDIE